MKTCHFFAWLFSAFILVVFVAALPLAAQTNAKDSPFDIVLKIRNIERTLSLVDKMLAGPDQASGASPTAITRGMLQGTDWIDSSRPIVGGLNFQNNKPPRAAILVPFTTPKEEFRKMVTAQAGPDYYLFMIPTGPLPENIDTIEAALTTIMKAGSKTALSLEVPLRQMIDREQTGINEFLTNIEAAPAPESQKAGASLSPRETREMMASIIDAAHQIDHLLLGINFNPENFETILDAEAVPGTNMFQLFSKESRIAHLNAYQPDYPMIFRSRGFNVSALTSLVSSTFGKIYQKIGIDISSAMAITDEMTGELAGGFSFDDNQPRFEYVAVMKKSDTDGTFIESVYLPWLVASGNNVPEELKYKGRPVYERTGTSEIDGRKVYSLKTRMVIQGGPGSVPGEITEPAVFGYDMLLTTVDNYFLTAPDENRLKKLIALCGTFESEPAPGPLMTADVEMGGYVKSLRQMSPALQQSSGLEMPAGKAVYRIDLAKGKAHLTATMKTDDLKKLLAIFQNLASSTEATETGGGATPYSATQKPPAGDLAGRETVSDKKSAEKEEYDSANYWYTRGSFCSTYGNDRAAISYYKKALERDADNPDYLYLLGVSYGETGQYQKALDSIDQALLMRMNDRYYYARGRVLLLSGEKEMAIENFKQAKSLGSPEARRYLDKYESEQ